MEQILTPSEPDKSLLLPAFFLFHSPSHQLGSRLICHYLFLSHSLSSPFCCGHSFHSLCAPVCQPPSPLCSRLFRMSVLSGQGSPPLLCWIRCLYGWSVCGFVCPSVRLKTPACAACWTTCYCLKPGTYFCIRESSNMHRQRCSWRHVMFICAAAGCHIN